MTASGTAIQNTRLVRSSLAQQRLVQEMQLAHWLPTVQALPLPTRLAARKLSGADDRGGGEGCR